MIVAKGRVRLRVKLIAAGLAALVLLGGGWVWLRDSSLVAVRRVTVTGVSGPDAGQIRSVLVLAARNMTTLDVRLGPLHTAVAPYPVVKDLGSAPSSRTGCGSTWSSSFRWPRLSRAGRRSPPAPTAR